MQRKDFIQSLAWLYMVTLAGCYRDKGVLNTATPDINALEPYTGIWNLSYAGILLRRATTGFSNKDIEQSLLLGLDKSIEKLLTATPIPTPPVNFEFKEDPFAPIEKTWVHSPYLEFIFFEQYRKKSLRTWAMENLYNEHFSIGENMLLFWLNHFGVSDVVEHKFEYTHIELLRKHALGNFRQLMKEVTIDPAMLRFLSGYENTSDSPNENYGREFLELFTVGKGELAGEGDYTTFTEADVAAASKVFSGWTDVGWYTFKADEQPGSIFRTKEHSSGYKNLSQRLDNQVILPLGKAEYARFVDIIFEQDAVALNICRKLYRWFIYSEITDETEKNVIIPLAALLQQNEFEIKPVLETLLKSNHFFEKQEAHPKIKNPVEYIFGILKYCPVSIKQDIGIRYNFWHEVFLSASAMGMEYLKPPSVAGWKAYYQAPGYYKFWINAATLQNRELFCKQIINCAFDIQGNKTGIDIRAFLKQFSKPSPSHIIAQASTTLFNQPLTTVQQERLNAILLGSYTENEWKIIAKSYITGTEAPEVEDNIRNFLTTLFSLPQFNVI